MFSFLLDLKNICKKLMEITAERKYKRLSVLSNGLRFTFGFSYNPGTEARSRHVNNVLDTSPGNQSVKTDLMPINQ
jgi:hypothetical protein